MTHEYSVCDFTYLEDGGRDDPCFGLPIDECDDDEDDRSEDDYERWCLEQDEHEDD